MEGEKEIKKVNVEISAIRRVEGGRAKEQAKSKSLCRTASNKFHPNEEAIENYLRSGKILKEGVIRLITPKNCHKK